MQQSPCTSISITCSAKVWISTGPINSLTHMIESGRQDNLLIYRENGRCLMREQRSIQPWQRAVIYKNRPFPAVKAEFAKDS